ncbi:hypothetical protein [Faecalicatena contorta]|uniref:hypothetical protein n=1 Tax=Faecalicatena contorta TaxID=39482 RepID=UPI0032171BF5
MSYSNLKAEMGRYNVTIESIASKLGIHRNSVSYKLNKGGSFSIEEADVIQKTFFPEIPLTVLFQKDETKEKQTLVR